VKNKFLFIAIIFFFSVEIHASAYIESVNPKTVVGSWSKQPLSIYGTNITPESKIRLCWPDNCITLKGERIKYKSSDELQIEIITGIKDKQWQITLIGVDGASSNTINFEVVSTKKHEKPPLNMIVTMNSVGEKQIPLLSHEQTISRLLMLDERIAKLTGAEPSMINYPTSIGAYGDNIYFADSETYNVFRYNRKQNVIFQLYATSSQIDSRMGGIHINSDLSFFVADKMSGSVFHFDMDGYLIKQYVDLKNMRSPVSVVFDEELATIYIADNVYDRVVLFDKNGVAFSTIGKRGTGAGKFMRIVDLSLGPDGVYVIDKQNKLIQVFSRTGEFRYSIPRGEVKSPSSITVDRKGRIYIADKSDNSIKIYGRRGYLQSFGVTGSGNGQFRSIGDIDADNEFLYVADSANNRIQILKIGAKDSGLDADK